MTSSSYEGNIILVLQAIKNNPKLSLRAAASECLITFI